MGVDEVVTAYGAAWNEPDPQARRELLLQAWTDEGIYTDPTASADGRDALIEHISGFQAAMPGHTIETTSGIDAHGDFFRFAWQMRHGTEVALEGMDFGVLAADGRISRIVGFFGPFPSIPE